MFKKMKMNSLFDKRIGKYLLYALGEIILVVVGILIALNINNFNEEKKQLQVLDGILKNVSYDLAVDTILVNQAITYYTERSKVTKEILNDSYTIEDYKSCLYCGNILGTYAPLELNDKGYSQLKNYYTNTSEKDSLSTEIVQFYKAYGSLVADFQKQIKENCFKNIEHFKDTQPWFYKVSAGKVEEDFYEYMTTLDYKNRIAYYDAIACKNMVAVLKGYKLNVIEVLKRIETRMETS